MEQKHQVLAENDLSGLIEKAYSVLKDTPDNIKDRFNDRKIYIDFSDLTDMSGKQMEIRLENATLTCSFDDHGICSGSFLFLDEFTDVQLYGDYLNKHYPFDLLRGVWKVHDSFLRITTFYGDSFFELSF